MDVFVNLQRWEICDHTAGAYYDPHKPEECSDCRDEDWHGDYCLVPDVAAALREYGQHKPLCAALATDGPFAPYPCNCGFDELLRSVS